MPDRPNAGVGPDSPANPASGSIMSPALQNPGEVPVNSASREVFGSGSQSAQPARRALPAFNTTTVAATFAGAYLFFTAMLIFQTNNNAINWDRAFVLLAGIEAIVFSAAGFLFGRTVQRQETVSVQTQASAMAANTETMRQAIEAAEEALAENIVGGGEATAVGNVESARTILRTAKIFSNRSSSIDIPPT